MSDCEFSFSDGSYIPTYGQILYRQQHGTEEEKEYYGEFGFPQIDFGSNSHIIALKDELNILFEEFYADRMLNAETMERWQRMLQKRYDIIAPAYDRAMALYTLHKDKMDSDVVAKQTTTYDNVTDSREGSTSSDSDSKVITTPDSAVNEGDDFADSRSHTSTTGSNGDTSVRTGSVSTEMESPGGLVANVNDNIDAWRNLATDFISEFDRNFLSVLWY